MAVMPDRSPWRDGFTRDFEGVHTMATRKKRTPPRKANGQFRKRKKR